MKLTIQTQKENKLLQRKEVAGTLEFEQATPSNADVVAAIAQQIGADPTLIVMQKIATHFGKKVAGFYAYAYATAEARKNVEPVTATMKKKAAEAKKAEKA